MNMKNKIEVKQPTSYKFQALQLDDESLAELNTLEECGYNVAKDYQRELRELFVNREN